MICPKCGFENPDTVFSCQKCDSELPTVRSMLPLSFPANKAPKSMADKIHTIRSNLIGERKVITVLFTDVVNYTSIAEKLDPEIVKQIMDGCFQVMVDQVYVYEGMVDKLLGDGLMAFFGAPLAHEDDAQRACYAALGIQKALEAYSIRLRQELGIEFRIRIGLHTGPVYIGSIGSDLKMDYTAIGDTVNLASRLEDIADPGSIIVSGDTYNLARDLFQFEPIGDIRVKGKEQSVTAFRLISPKKEQNRFEAAVARGLTPFVGRERELEDLHQVLAKMKLGKGQIVSIVGEPGIGKSRLLLEFRRTLTANEYLYLEGRCFRYGQTPVYQPLVDILKSFLGIGDHSSDTDIKNAILERIKQLELPLQNNAAFLQDILGIRVEDERYLRMENQYRREKLFETVTSLLVSESRHRPVIIAVEDLHWIDNASEEFLRFLVQHSFGKPIVLVLTYRMDYALNWISSKDHNLIHLSQFHPATGTDFIKAILTGKEPDGSVISFILSKAGGNPLFVEEFVRSLLENGIVRPENGQYILTNTAASVSLPDNIKGIIAARIDRLPEETRNLMQVASVSGRYFNNSILKEVVPSAIGIDQKLDLLQQLDLIENDSTHEQQDWCFKHALIQEVAYSNLLQKRRRELHENIGAAIEKLYPDRIPEYFEILAHHFQQGYSQDKAVTYLVRSGQRSLKKYACEESHHYYQEAYNILHVRAPLNTEDQKAIIDLIIEWALVHYYRADFIGLTALLDQYEPIVNSLNDKRQKAWFFAWMGFARCHRGKIREAYDLLLLSVRLAEESGDQRALAYACSWVGWTGMLLGRHQEAVKCGKQAYTISQGLEQDDYPYFKSIGAMGTCFSQMGQEQKAREYGDLLIRDGERHGNNRSICSGYTVYGFTDMACGNIEAAVQAFQLGLKVSVDPEYELGLKTFLVMALMSGGRFQVAKKELSTLIPILQAHGMEFVSLPLTGFMGICLLAGGQMNIGLAMLDKARDSLLAEQSMMYYALLELVEGRVYAMISTGQAAIKPSVLLKNITFIIRQMPLAGRKALQHFEQANKVFRQAGTRVYEGLSYLEIGHLYLQKRRLKLASENLSRAIEIFTECDAQGYLKQAKELLEKLN